MVAGSRNGEASVRSRKHLALSVVILELAQLCQGLTMDTSSLPLAEARADEGDAWTEQDTVMPSATTQTPADAQSVVGFWEEAGEALWFAKDPAFDARFRERFLTLHEAATRGELAGWASTADGALALVILLDQFPRNAFRGTPRMYATDAMAREVADAAIAAGYDRIVSPELQVFFYMPFGHSENVADQERSVTLCQRVGQPHVAFAEHHRDIVRRFGRFPHRNAILGRVSTPEERQYLEDGGYAG
jgi:uncharacterized protein (DUF924 family)